MSQPVEEKTTSTPLWRRGVALAAMLLFVLAVSGTSDAGAIDIYGVSVHVGVFGVAMYVLGALTTWGATRK